jgi:hypothetical protein
MITLNTNGIKTKIGGDFVYEFLHENKPNILALQKTNINTFYRNDHEAIMKGKVALIDLTRLLSGLDCTLWSIHSSVLGGLIAKSVSIINLIGNFFDIFLEASIKIPFVIRPEISSKMAFDICNG